MKSVHRATTKENARPVWPRALSTETSCHCESERQCAMASNAPTSSQPINESCFVVGLSGFVLVGSQRLNELSIHLAIIEKLAHHSALVVDVLRPECADESCNHALRDHRVPDLHRLGWFLLLGLLGLLLLLRRRLLGLVLARWLRISLAWSLGEDVREQRLLEVARGLAVDRLPEAPPKKFLVALADALDVALGAPAEHPRSRLFVRAPAGEGPVQNRGIIGHLVVNARQEGLLHVPAHVLDRLDHRLPILGLVSLADQPHLLLGSLRQHLEEDGLLDVPAAKARSVQLVRLLVGQVRIGVALVAVRPQAAQQEGGVEATRVALNPLLDALALRLRKQSLGVLQLLVAARADDLAEQRVVRAQALHALAQKLGVQLGRRSDGALHEVLETSLEQAAQFAIRDFAQSLAVLFGVNLIHAAELAFRQGTKNPNEFILVRPPTINCLVHCFRISLRAKLQHFCVVAAQLQQMVVLATHTVRPVIIHRLGPLCRHVVLLGVLPYLGDLALKCHDQLLCGGHILRFTLEHVAHVRILVHLVHTTQVKVVTLAKEVLIHITQLERPVQIGPAQQHGLFLVKLLLEVRAELVGVGRR
mmetsp:Transcript_88083/g.269509  ORF Transcript_88083/g.269509 Transcript_88083/m.269509 type:complete len:591 (+) Transcript_88083:164-1936(+)